MTLNSIWYDRWEWASNPHGRKTGLGEEAVVTIVVIFFAGLEKVNERFDPIVWCLCCVERKKEKIFTSHNNLNRNPTHKYQLPLLMQNPPSVPIRLRHTLKLSNIFARPFFLFLLALCTEDTRYQR